MVRMNVTKDTIILTEKLLRASCLKGAVSSNYTYKSSQKLLMLT